MNVLLVRLESPLMAFGGVVVDQNGVIDDLPSVSLLTGLFGNALGYRRTDHARLQRLQDRLQCVIRIDRAGVQIRDFQTAALAKDDQGWTTLGRPEGRAGGADSYKGKHLRYRDYHADAAATVALRLHPEDEAPTLADIAHALDYPARPLFVGRKPCLPSTRVCLGIVDADDLLAAIRGAPGADDSSGSARIYAAFSAADATGAFEHYGRRNWSNDVHEGMERWSELPGSKDA